MRFEPLLMIAPRFGKYVVSGLLALSGHLLVLTLLVEGWAMNVTLATSLGFCVGLLVNYIIQHQWVFRVDGAHRTLFTRFVSVTLLTFALNILLFRLAYERFGLSYLLAQVTATGVIFIANFVINVRYTFRLGV